ncbi:FCD domain-containing protein [Photobacterium sp. BZF1]|uniref:GntR family transcriptional regulator n=1 Tax=Photobacterium sp. BZF1 TaxID=1904457 RepID=UPI001653BA0E|nr:GntR family transcriptional regulator [Photobacterium sp. BZF1]MBC7004141.1 FCD domain-containing protein [Photobacterium sp. BZF1]
MQSTVINEQVQTVKNQSLSKVVQQQLETMILNGELAPGERINESYLSSHLQISRAPIREACRQLAQYGMVETRTGKGSFVCQVDLKEAIELYEIRGAFDALAAEQAASRASEDDINALEQHISQMEESEKANDRVEYFSSNLKFHHQIVLISRNSALLELYSVVLKKLSLFRQLNLSKPNQIADSLAQHKGIFAAIKTKDATKASELARQHVEEAKQRLLEAKQ